MRGWLSPVLAVLFVVPFAHCRAAETAVQRLREVLKQPLLLTAGVDSAATQFSCDLWSQSAEKAFLIHMERMEADVAIVSTYADGTPFSVQVNSRSASFLRDPHPGWVFAEGNGPHLSIWSDADSCFQFEDKVSTEQVAEIRLDVESLVRGMLRAPEKLRCSADGRIFETTTSSSKARVILELANDPKSFPVVRYDVLQGGQGAGVRFQTNRGMQPVWTRVNLANIKASLHDDALSQAARDARPTLSIAPPTEAARRLSWELPKLLDIKVIPAESPSELLRRTLARPSLLAESDVSVVTRFAIERRLQTIAGASYQVFYERVDDEFAMLIRTPAGEPVALAGGNWLFALKPQRGWVLCNGLFAKGGSLTGKLPGWKLGRSIGDGALSLDLDPFVDVRQFRNADWKFDETRNRLSMVSANNNVTLDLTPDAEDFPLRHARVQVGKSVDEQTYVHGEAMKPVWTKVTAEWLRRELKPAEVPFSESLYSGLVEQLQNGLSEEDQAVSKRFAEAVEKLAASQ